MDRPIWLLTDAGMDDHHAPGHPERPDRRRAAADGVRDAAGERLVEPPCLPVDDATIALVHDPELLATLEEAERRGGEWLDPDTYVVPGSMAAARLAAGATIQAALGAAAGEAEIAFAAVRPPGHHASDSHAGGFCLLNSIALAAAGLRRDGIARRIAIVDWDVHHGDGTQAIFEADPDLCYASTHQWPLYPGTGLPTDRGVGPGAGTKHNLQLEPGSGDAAFVDAWVGRLLPAIEAFTPDAILVSAGYDGHRADPLAHLRITEDGYRSVAHELGALSARLDHPGLALTLEGGYDLDAVRGSVAATVSGLLAGRAAAP